ncbi:type II secretion system minor pseudopilin GspI [Salmonella enterica]
MVKPYNDDGFILIEAMLAIAILSVVGLSLMRVTQITQKSTMSMRENLCSEWVAENQAATLSIAPMKSEESLRSGDEVMCSSIWHWIITRHKSNDLRIEFAEIQVFSGDHKKKKHEIIIPR